MRLYSFISQHGIEQLPAIATPLYSFVHIEVKNAKRLHFNKRVHSCPDEEFLVPNLDEANSFVCHFEVACVFVGAELAHSCDNRR